MSRSKHLRRTLLISAGVFVTAIALAIAGGLYAASVELRRAVDEKCLALTADWLHEFVDEHGRWPRSEAEYLDHLGVPQADREFERTHGELSRVIIEYDCDLMLESLDSPEEFRCLRPRDPAAMRQFSPWHLERLLEALREVRDGRWPPRVPVGQALPDDAEEASAGEADGSREGSVPERKAAAK